MVLDVVSVPDDSGETIFCTHIGGANWVEARIVGGKTFKEAPMPKGEG